VGGHSLLAVVLHYFKKPFHFDALDKYLGAPGFRILDVGCGNHAPSKTKMYYPQCRYFGLDKAPEYNLYQNDFDCMEKFFAVDLEDPLALETIPEKSFNCIIMNHVIEHLKNGEQVLRIF